MNYCEFIGPIASAVSEIGRDYEIVGTIDLAIWNDDYENSKQWLKDRLNDCHRSEYLSHQRILCLHSKDYFVQDDTAGLILKNLQIMLNEIDITSSFVIVASTDPDLQKRASDIDSINSDENKIQFLRCQGDWQTIGLESYPYSQEEIYQYGSVNPIKIKLSDLDQRKKTLLSESKTFCMYPWIHIHAYPTGDVYPCCHAEMADGPVGNAKQQDLKTLWNSEKMKQIRLDMLNEKSNPYCVRCYEQEAAGFFGGRQSANKHHGHHVNRIDQTRSDGSLENFEMTYWDIRFSNLCNLRCRSCGHIFSSSWYQDQAKLAGPQWTAKNRVLNFAGKTETDIWEQLVPHLDFVEQIYFAGGEPLMMQEHYNILDELERRGRFDVRLIYNTNFTHTRLKDRSVFDYWKKFRSVSVGASLDAMGDRAEYIRKGTDWAIVEDNRRQMLEICPEVDFYISATLSIYNAWHLPDFHRDWVSRGLIQPRDLNVNVLQDPSYLRVDIAPINYKQRIRVKIEEHLEWLRDQDPLQRATVGFESVIRFMMATDNTHMIENFWRKTHQLDEIRNEQLLAVLPELEALL